MLKWQYNVSLLTECVSTTIEKYPIINLKDIHSFSYTSGTTGIPKGAMVN